MKTLFLMLFVVSVGVGQTREERGWPVDTLSKFGTTVTIIQPQSREEKKENVREISRRIAKGRIVLQPNFEIAHYDTAWHLSEDFWRAFAVKWREYEAWCREGAGGFTQIVIDSIEAPYRMNVRIPGRTVQLNKGEKLYYVKRATYETSTPISPTLPGFIDWLERKK